MRFASAVFFSGLLAAVSAHFQLQYPPPRGDFVEDDEPTFCGTYSSLTRILTLLNPIKHRWVLYGRVEPYGVPDHGREDLDQL